MPQPFLLLWIACDGVGGPECQLKAVFLMSGGAVEGLAGSVRVLSVPRAHRVLAPWCRGSCSH